MFRIKICGITTPTDAQAVAVAGADAIGLNFYERSPRYVTPAVAAEIAESLPAAVVRVGVFVNATVDEIGAIADSVRLDMIQLHGDEPADTLTQLAPRRIIRAFRCRDSGLDDVVDWLLAAERLGVEPDAILLDAYAPDAYGGTGRRLDCEQVRNAPDLIRARPLILAGGLTGRNVGDAVRAARPTAVDTASGVEREPGVKDLRQVEEFVTAAADALREVHQA